MKACWVIGMVIASGVHAEECSVNVYLVTGVLVPAGMLGDAEKKATQMFREIGVKLRTRDGIPSHDLSNGCGAPIVVQVEDAAGYRGHSDALAYAAPYRESGTCIHVFLDRVVHLSSERGFANILLAHVMAHEIAHVLEGIKRHSEEGVMKAAWARDDYRRMARHPLSFAEEDVRLIGEGIAKRQRAGDFAPAP